jgi:hypothetical protein
MRVCNQALAGAAPTAATAVGTTQKPGNGTAAASNSTSGAAAPKPAGYAAAGNGTNSTAQVEQGGNAAVSAVATSEVWWLILAASVGQMLWSLHL